MSLVRIEMSERGEWKTIPLDAVVGGHFRVLVDGEVVYDSKGEGLDQPPAPSTKVKP